MTNEDLNKASHFYFIGIGGIGMSALARYFNSFGKKVAGYDRTSSEITGRLSMEGVKIHLEDNVDLIPPEFKDPGNNVLVVYTPAVPLSHTELSYFIENGYEVKKRAEVLGLIASNGYAIAIAGTHGKTTITTMIAHILKSAGIDCLAFLGGISSNYNSNLVMHGNEKNIVVEADEFDRSFLMLNPDIAVVSAIDPDHLDVYGEKEEMEASYIHFINKLKDNGTLIQNGSTTSLKIGSESGQSHWVYSLDDNSDFKAENVHIENGTYHFDAITTEGKIENIALGLPGRHNVENAIAAIAVSTVLGINGDEVKRALVSFKGVQRRFEYHILSDDVVYIDDYAHHPKELNACIGSVRELFPNKKITGVFQPHLYSRTRDFADQFASSLSALDELILLDIYPARELPVEGVSSELILNKVSIDQKQLSTKADLLDLIDPDNIEVLITLGAGDIDQLVDPIKKKLSNK